MTAEDVPMVPAAVVLERVVAVVSAPAMLAVEPDVDAEALAVSLVVLLIAALVVALAVAAEEAAKEVVSSVVFVEAAAAKSSAMATRRRAAAGRINCCWDCRHAAVRWTLGSPRACGRAMISGLVRFLSTISEGRVDDEML